MKPNPALDASGAVRGRLAHRVDERDDEKDGREADGGDEEGFFYPSFGVVDVATATKSSAESGAPILEENRCDEENRDDKLDNI